MRRLAFVVLLFLLWAPGAYAWTWPAQGPVLLLPDPADAEIITLMLRL